MQQLLGQFFLNISFGLYLVLYLPQLFYNATEKPFKNMSLVMYLMSLQAYSCDLFYALGRGMPWQYLSVSAIGICYLFIWQTQWFFYNRKHQPQLNIPLMLSGLIIILWSSILWYLHPKALWQIHLQAWVSRIFFILHFLPQIVKYHRNDIRRNAISPYYLYLSLSLSLCDFLAAACLKWDTVIQMGSIVSFVLKSYLYYQMWALSSNSRPIGKCISSRLSKNP